MTIAEYVVRMFYKDCKNSIEYDYAIKIISALILCKKHYFHLVANINCIQIF